MSNIGWWRHKMLPSLVPLCILIATISSQCLPSVASFESVRLSSINSPLNWWQQGGTNFTTTAPIYLSDGEPSETKALELLSPISSTTLFANDDDDEHAHAIVDNQNDSFKTDDSSSFNSAIDKEPLCRPAEPDKTSFDQKPIQSAYDCKTLVQSSSDQHHSTVTLPSAFLNHHVKPNLSNTIISPQTINAKTSPNGEITVINGKHVMPILYEQEFVPTIPHFDQLTGLPSKNQVMIQSPPDESNDSNEEEEGDNEKKDDEVGESEENNDGDKQTNHNKDDQVYNDKKSDNKKHKDNLVTNNANKVNSTNNEDSNNDASSTTPTYQSPVKVSSGGGRFGVKVSNMPLQTVHNTKDTPTATTITTEYPQSSSSTQKSNTHNKGINERIEMMRQRYNRKPASSSSSVSRVNETTTATTASPGKITVQYTTTTTTTTESVLKYKIEDSDENSANNTDTNNKTTANDDSNKETLSKSIHNNSSFHPKKQSNGESRWKHYRRPVSHSTKSPSPKTAIYSSTTPISVVPTSTMMFSQGQMQTNAKDLEIHHPVNTETTNNKKRIPSQYNRVISNGLTTVTPLFTTISTSKWRALQPSQKNDKTRGKQHFDWSKPKSSQYQDSLSSEHYLQKPSPLTTTTTTTTTTTNPPEVVVTVENKYIYLRNGTPTVQEAIQIGPKSVFQTPELNIKLLNTKNGQTMAKNQNPEAGHIGNHYRQQAEQIMQHINSALNLPSYVGYGTNKGTSSETKINHHHQPEKSSFYYGQSNSAQEKGKQSHWKPTSMGLGSFLPMNTQQQQATYNTQISQLPATLVTNNLKMIQVDPYLGSSAAVQEKPYMLDNKVNNNNYRTPTVIDHHHHPMMKLAAADANENTESPYKLVRHFFNTYTVEESDPTPSTIELDGRLNMKLKDIHPYVSSNPYVSTNKHSLLLHPAIMMQDQASSVVGKQQSSLSPMEYKTHLHQHKQTIQQGLVRNIPSHIKQNLEQHINQHLHQHEYKLSQSKHASTFPRKQQQTTKSTSYAVMLKQAEPAPSSPVSGIPSTRTLPLSGKSVLLSPVSIAHLSSNQEFKPTNVQHDGPEWMANYFEFNSGASSSSPVLRTMSSTVTQLNSDRNKKHLMEAVKQAKQINAFPREQLHRLIPLQQQQQNSQQMLDKPTVKPKDLVYYATTKDEIDSPKLLPLDSNVYNLKQLSDLGNFRPALYNRNPRITPSDSFLQPIVDEQALSESKARQFLLKAVSSTTDPFEEYYSDRLLPLDSMLDYPNWSQPSGLVPVITKTSPWQKSNHSRVQSLFGTSYDQFSNLHSEKETDPTENDFKSLPKSLRKGRAKLIELLSLNSLFNTAFAAANKVNYNETDDLSSGPLVTMPQPMGTLKLSSSAMNQLVNAIGTAATVHSFESSQPQGLQHGSSLHSFEIPSLSPSSSSKIDEATTNEIVGRMPPQDNVVASSSLIKYPVTFTDHHHHTSVSSVSSVPISSHITSLTSPLSPVESHSNSNNNNNKVLRNLKQIAHTVNKMYKLNGKQ